MEFENGYLHAILCPKSFSKVQASPAPYSTTYPTCMENTSIWKTTQYSTTDKSPLLDEHATNQIQAISGTFLYYAHAVHPTILPGLNEISNQQAKPTENTVRECRQLIDYSYTHPKAVMCFNSSGMILSLVLDAAYLVLPDARSRCATLYTLTDIATSDPPTIKSIGHALVKTICGVPASVSEAETIGIFMGAQEAVPMLNTLVELGHPQRGLGTPSTWSWDAHRG